MEQLVGRVSAIQRYPVKSLLGESLVRVQIDERGLVGDRQWALRNDAGKFGSGKTTRRFQFMNGLLALGARYDHSVPVIMLPDGTEYRAEDDHVHHALSGWLGIPVTLTREATISHFDEGPVSLITSSSLSRLSEYHGSPVDPRRFRANFLIEVGANGFVEDNWVGRALGIGSDCRMTVKALLSRCVMVNNAQESLCEDPGILQTLAQKHGANFGVWGHVDAPGDVSIGDPVAILDETWSRITPRTRSSRFMP